MSLCVGELYALLTIDDSKFNKGLDQAEGRINKAGSAVGTAFKAGALVAGLAVTTLVGTALVKGFQRLSSIENATAKLQGLGHSASEVKGIMDDVLASVKGTAFGLDEAATIAAGVVASGIEPGKQLRGTLKLVADAATIAGTSMGEMGAMFNKVAASNKIQGDVIAQLNDAGIPIVQLLGESMGKTTAEVYKMSKAGTITFPMFAKAMEAGLGGSALKSGNTTVGAFKNVMAALSRFGASILTGVFPLIAPAFAAITKVLDNLGAKVGPVFTRIGEALKEWLKGKQAADLFAYISSIFSTLVPIVVSLVQTGFNALVTVFKFLAQHGEVVKTVILALVVGFTAYEVITLSLRAGLAVVTAAQWLWNAALTANPTGLIIIAIAALVAAFVVLWTKCDWFRNFWIAVWEHVKVVFAAVWPVIQTVIGYIVGGLQTAWTAIAAAITWFWGWAGPFIKTAIDVWWTQISTVVGYIVAGISTAWDWIKPKILAFWDWAGPFIKTAIDVWWTQISTVVGYIVAGISTAWDWIKPKILAFWDWAGPFITLAVQSWWSSIQTAFGLIKGVFEWLWPIVVKIVQGAIANIKTAVDVIGDIVGVVRGVFTTVRDAAVTWWGKITDAVQAGIGFVKKAVDVVKDIIGVIAGVWTTIHTTAGEWWGRIKGVVTDAIDFIKGAPGKAKDAIVKAFGGVWDGISSAATTAWNGIIGVIGGFINKIIRIVNYLPGVDIAEVHWGEGGIAGKGVPVPAYAQGVARVNRPTVALIGEDGPEAVLPLSKPGRMRAILSELGLFSSSPITGMTKAGQKPPLFGGIPAFAEGGIVGDIKGFFGDLWGSATEMFGALRGLISDLDIPALPWKGMAGFLPEILKQVWATVKQQFQDAFGKRPGIVRNATEHLGDPYVWGGTQPGGFDCSGLIWHAYNQAGISIARPEVYGGTVIPMSALQTADVLLYDPGAIQLGVSVPFGHYRMYAGGGQTVESGGGGVHMDALANNPPAQIRTFLKNGGITRGLSVVGEGGRPEAVVPLTNPRRGAEVLRAAGLLPGGGNVTTTIHVDARGSSDPAAVEAAARRGAIIGLAEARRATTRTTGRSR